MKHTPGPWFVGAQNDATFVIDKRPAMSNDYPNHDANVAAIAKVYNGQHCDANARLMAASPKLLAVLKRSLSWLSSYPGGGAVNVYNEAREAIAEAEEGQ